MILFCDTSALVKLYLLEDGSDTVASSAAESEALVVCRLTWVEVMSALARRTRERPQDVSILTASRQRFMAHWPEFLCLEVTQELTELAGDYADTFALRAYDSVQLAAAHFARRNLAGDVAFACFDTRLAKAARVLGLQTTP